MTLTPEGLEQLGYQKLTQPLKAMFYLTDVYAIEGLKLQSPDVCEFSGRVGKAHFKAAIGNCIVELDSRLHGGALRMTEEEWAEENQYQPPYLLISVGPHQGVATEGHVKSENGALVCNDCFPGVRRELREERNAVAASLVSGLTCAFSSATDSVSFRPAMTRSFGSTADGQTVLDRVVETRAKLIVSRDTTNEAVRSKVDRALAISSRLLPQVSNFMRLGLNESDPLKQFLFFFLSLEIAANGPFERKGGRWRLRAVLGRMSPPPSPNSIKYLRDRFAWCVANQWQHLNDGDLREFGRMKRVRDDIAHGEIDGPSSEDVLALKALALRVHGGG